MEMGRKVDGWMGGLVGWGFAPRGRGAREARVVGLILGKGGGLVVSMREAAAWRGVSGSWMGKATLESSHGVVE